MTDWEIEQITKISKTIVKQYTSNSNVDFEDAVQQMLLHCIEYDKGYGNTPKERIRYLSTLARYGLGIYFHSIGCGVSNRDKPKEYATDAKDDEKDLDLISNTDELKSVDDKDAFLKQIECCTPSQKKVLSLRFIDGMKYCDIDELLGYRPRCSAAIAKCGIERIRLIKNLKRDGQFETTTQKIVTYLDEHYPADKKNVAKILNVGVHVIDRAFTIYRIINHIKPPVGCPGKSLKRTIEYIIEHPQSSITMTMRDVGVSKTTVSRARKIIKEQNQGN